MWGNHSNQFDTVLSTGFGSLASSLLHAPDMFASASAPSSATAAATVSPSAFLKSASFNDRARRLVQLVNTMRDAGAHMDLDLPTVVVCGNQSVGKSSLVEALCGISLPRAEGTCTRSVIEVRMTENPINSPNPATSAEVGELSPLAKSPPAITSLSINSSTTSTPWSCTIKLRFEVDATGVALKTPREIPFGKEIRDPGLVELHIRRAQKALLNPSTESSKFLDVQFDDRTAASRDKEAASNEIKFTRNVICVDIRGAGVNLTLIDLPGIIRSVDRKEDAPYIDLIQDLVRKYIVNDRAIIVGTITCKDEIDNQAIVHMAKEVDPLGQRTIGVLTKPDTIEAGTHDRWVQILLGQNYNLKIGYWMVKNPSKADLDRHISFEEARAKEETFFASHAPWSSLRNQMDRFGIDSLRREMGRQLAILTDSALPDMKAKTEETMNATAMELSKMPPLLSDNSRIELLQMIRHFSTLLGYNLAAHQDFKGFYQRVRQHFEGFRKSLYSARPIFALDRKPSSTTYSSTSSAGSSAVSMVTSSVSAISSVLWSSGSNSGRGNATPTTATKFASSTSPIGSNTNTHSDPNSSDSTTVDTTRPLTIADVRRIIDSQKGRELQGYSPYGAFTFIVAAFQEEWGRHASACVNNVSQELYALVQKLTDEVFGRFVNLHGQVRFVIQAVQSDLHRVTMELVNNLVAMERRYPFTMGSEDFTRLKSTALHEFKAQLELARTASATTPGSFSSSVGGSGAISGRHESVNTALAALAELGYTGLTPRDLVRLRDNPEDDDVLNVMAASDAYFRLAFKRVGDVVPMHIDYHFLSRFGDGLEKELVARLGVLEKDAAAVATMVMEDRFVAERRRALMEQRTRLENVWRALHNFGL